MAHERIEYRSQLFLGAGTNFALFVEALTCSCCSEEFYSVQCSPCAARIDFVEPSEVLPTVARHLRTHLDRTPPTPVEVKGAENPAR